MTKPHRATAVEKLTRSRLRPDNLHGLGDVDLEKLVVTFREVLGINVIDLIEDATLERTIEGASTLRLTVLDDRLEFLRSGYLRQYADIEIDGLWFRLAGISKQDRHLTLTFEDREVSLLRGYTKKKIATRDKVTRAEFVLSMIKEVKQEKIAYVIPELHKTQPIQTAKDLAAGTATATGTPGFPPNLATTREFHQGGSPGGRVIRQNLITVKGVLIKKDQLNNAAAILSTGMSMGARRKVLVCSLMTAIQEATLHNLPGGDRDSVGLFQQRASWGSYRDRHDPATAARLFFESAITFDKDNPQLEYGALCQAVQHSAFPHAYTQWRSEAEALVAAYGQPYSSSGADPTGANASAAGAPQAGAGAYLYYRGKPPTSKHTHWRPESSWTCIQRLASEVNWRAFMVAGVFHFEEEKELFKSRPLMTVNESKEGVDSIDFDYDVRKKIATVTIRMQIKRWKAPPGSVVMITEMGPINGRWLVSSVSRSLFNTDGEIVVKKPVPTLPEPLKDNLSAAQHSTYGGGYGAPTVPAGPGSQRLGQAIADAALTQLGVPYKWGGEKPNSFFDCSGLVQWAHRKAGVTPDLPRTSQDQFANAPEHPIRAQLLPGDLVFYEGPHPGHVAICIGGNQVVHAPHTGDHVRKASIDMMPITGYGRWWGTDPRKKQYG